MTVLTTECLEGYTANTLAARSDYLKSSPSWLAFTAGKILQARGYGKPRLAKLSRGYSIRVKMIEGHEHLVKFSNDLSTITIHEA